VNLKKIINKIKEKRFEIKDAHEQHYADVNSSIIQSELEIVDWMSVPFNIELRHPFFDKRLVEFCLAIPTEQKISNGWDRYIMRRSMSKILPEEIQWRKTKGDLSFNFVRSFMDEKEQIEKLTMENNYLIEKYVSSKKFKEIYKECKSGNTENIMYIWNALLLNLWLSKRD